MRGQFLLDMLIGWIVYTKEGKETANKVFNKAMIFAKDNLKNININSFLCEKNEVKNERPTMDK